MASTFRNDSIIVDANWNLAAEYAELNLTKPQNKSTEIDYNINLHPDDTFVLLVTKSDEMANILKEQLKFNPLYNLSPKTKAILSNDMYAYYVFSNKVASQRIASNSFEFKLKPTKNP